MNNLESDKTKVLETYPNLSFKKENLAKKDKKLETLESGKSQKTSGKVLKNNKVLNAEEHRRTQKNIKDGKPFMAGVSPLIKGQKLNPTILKEEARERYINKMNQIQDRLIVAQTTLAIGSMQVLAKVPYEENGVEKTRLQLIEDTQLIIDILTNTDLEAGEDFFVIKKTEPNQQAIAYVLDQTIGKPVAKTEVTGKDRGAIESNSNVTVEFINAKKLNNET